MSLHTLLRKQWAIALIAPVIVIAACGGDGNTTGMEPPPSAGHPGFLHYNFAGDLVRYDIEAGGEIFRQSVIGSGPNFAPDGSFYTNHRLEGDVFDGDEDIFLFDLVTGDLVTQFLWGGGVLAADGREENAIRPGPGGRYFAGIAAEGSDAFLHVSNRNGDTVLRLPDDLARIKGHAWAPDESLIVTGIGDTTAAMWVIEDVTEPQPELQMVTSFAQPWESVPEYIAVSADGGEVAYILNGAIWMGSLTPGASDHRVVVTASRPFFDVAFSPDAEQLVVGMERGLVSFPATLHLVDVPTTGTVQVSEGGPTEITLEDGTPAVTTQPQNGIAWFDH